MSNPTISAYDPIPSLHRRATVTVRTDLPGPDEVGAVAVPVVSGGDAPPELGVDAAALKAAGFTGERAQTLVLPHPDGVVRVAVGLGSAGTVDATLVRDVAAEFARAVPQHTTLSVEIPADDPGISVADFAQAVTEGVLLARWRFRVGADKDERTLDGLVLVAAEEQQEEAREGARIGRAIAEAYNLGRDLANCPATTLTATRMAEVAEQLAPGAGLTVEVFDKDQLIEMSCGGILGVNMGSAEPPRLIRIRYAPESPTGRLALIGKGVMYDSGGISLKPSDESHAQMKNDMTGAAAIL
jgi:leucyl aminopeptidase